MSLIDYESTQLCSRLLNHLNCSVTKFARQDLIINYHIKALTKTKNYKFSHNL